MVTLYSQPRNISIYMISETSIVNATMLDSEIL